MATKSIPGSSFQTESQKAEMNYEPDRTAGLLLIEAAIRSLRRQGVTTAADLARALNDQGVTTPKGERWHAMLVQRLLAMGTTERRLP